MRLWLELTPEERIRVELKAARFYKAHPNHVDTLRHASDLSYPPSGSDLFRPELWKPGHWVWAFENLDMEWDGE